MMMGAGMANDDDDDDEEDYDELFDEGNNSM